VEGFESSSGLELLSTVHWVVMNEDVHSVDDVIARVHDWNERKLQFTPRQIALAIQVLKREGWIEDQLEASTIVGN